MSTFSSDQITLPDVLSDIVSGKIQLPDFQRGWIWDDEHVQSLLTSIARSFPIGAVMLLETGGDMRFQVRPIEHVSFSSAVPEAESLILDGQQRLTTLTQVLKLTAPVKTRNARSKAIERYYYFDMNLALEGTDRIEDSIIAVGSDRKIKSNFGQEIDLDLSTRELECKNFCFPCTEIIDSDDWEESLDEFSPERSADFRRFRKQVIRPFRDYQIPIIKLRKETTKEAVCLVFEKVNTGGVPLSVFELITATYAADGYNLRDDWFGSNDRKVSSRQKNIAQQPLLANIEATDFLQTITLLHTYERHQQDIANGKSGKQATAISAKRTAILALPLEAYTTWAAKAEQGYISAAHFLQQQCFYAVRDIPYSTQIPVIAAILTHLEDDWRTPVVNGRLSRWYWCGVLGELYGGAVETRIANDLGEVLAWARNKGAEPRTVTDAVFQPDRLRSLKSRVSAAYKGINTLVLRKGAQDFYWKANIQQLDQTDVQLDFHHIFPRKWCQSQGISPKTYDAIVNKTPISYKANRKIGGAAPSQYLAKLQADDNVQLDDTAMDSILAGHLIDPKTLRNNDFQTFFDHRFHALLEVIGSAMGKKIELEEALETEAQSEVAS